MKFIDYGGETTCLILARPNRKTHPKLTALLPFTSVEDALSHRQGRHSFSRSAKYTYEYTPWLANAGIATEFRIGLQRLKDEPVAVPLWDDGIKLTAGCSIGATTLQKAAGDDPVRSGAEWILMYQPVPATWDGYIYEIVTVTGMTSTTVTLASPGTANGWVPGTIMYPLLFGRLEERPTLDSRTPQKVEGALKIREDSPFARKLNVTAGTIPTVGANIIAFNSTPLWDIQPVWDEVLDSTEVDIEYRQVGFLRQEQKQVYAQDNRGTLEITVVCRDRATIAKVERLFMNRLGPVLPFMVPSFRQDLVITADLPIPGFPNRITIENSEYSDSERPVQADDSFMALVEPGPTGTIDPVKLNTVFNTTLTTAVAITQPHLVGKTRLSRLLLCCFASPEITWEYSTPHRARCRIKFIERPDEYATPNTGVKVAAYLFEWTTETPTPQVQRFTSYENAISYDGHTWTPAPFSHGSSKSGLRLEKEECEIATWGGDFPGNPVSGLFPYTLEGQLSLRVIEVNADNPDDLEVPAYAKVLFSGVVSKPDFKGKDWKAVALWLGKYLELNVPGYYYQQTCNVAVYSPRCAWGRPGMKAEFLTVCALGTFASLKVLDVTYVSGQVITEVNYFGAGGLLETGVDANYESRTIFASEQISGGHRITIDRPLRRAVIGQHINVYPTCNLSGDMCRGRFNNGENFLGAEYRPNKNPTFNIGEVANNTGGKKGQG